ncbi:MAG TPA: glycosyltransferase family 2 protein [Cyclobacteriaceae bacterium]|nr:glycosyltransferase family 2 protein [Cyclobacteriaceae bacterium]
MPRLTLIMSAFNAATFVEEAINSLLNQTFTDFELWIIDDGSTDSTRAKIDLFKDNRIKKFYFNENRGRVLCVNEFAARVTSEYFGITDADDVSHPTRIEKQIALLDQYQEVAMCGTSYWAIDENGLLIRKLELAADYAYIREANLVQPQFHGPTSIFRTNMVRKLGEFYRLYFKRNMADTDLAARVVDQFPSVNITEPLYYYRIVRTSVSRKEFSFRFAMIDRTIIFLSKQRRTIGRDSLQGMNKDDLDKFVADWESVYASDSSRLLREAAFYHLYWKVSDKALRSACQAFLIKPLQPKNWLCLGFCVGLGFVYGVQGLLGKHYQSLLK